MSTDEKLTRPSLLPEVEAALDANYAKAHLPHPNRTLATWYLLMVGEDSQRNALGADLDQPSANALVLSMDRCKYSLRHGLDRIRRESIDHTWERVPRPLIPLLYKKAAILLGAGMDFADATKLCGAIRQGTVRLSKNEGVVDVELDPFHHDDGY